MAKKAVQRPRRELTEAPGLTKLPPQSLDAERSVLGSVLLLNERLDDVLEIIQPRSFYSDAHRTLFDTIVSMREAGKLAIDAVTLATELDRRGLLEEVGGAGYLAEILAVVPHAGNAVHYARIVREKWVQRDIIYASTETLDEAYAGADDVESLLSRAEQRMFAISLQQESGKTLDLRSILLEAWPRLLDRRDSDEATSGLSSGFYEVDRYTSGFQPAELIILAARPSMGKTAFVCNCSLNMADPRRGGHGVLVFSLEQAKEELAERFLSIHARVDGQKLRQGTFDDSEHDQLVKASELLSAFPLFIDDQPGRTMSQIAAVSRRIHRQQKGLGAVVIDYLQLIEAEDKNMPREQQIASITRRLKFLAKELRIPVIALSQLNRGVESRDDKKPRLSDLRESGAIEQDADVVMFLHRPDAYDSKDRPGEADLIIAKNRGGPIGIARLVWIKQQLRFGDFSPLQQSGHPTHGDDF